MKNSIILAVIMLLVACSGDKKQEDASANNENYMQTLQAKTGLSEFELVNGIGPVKGKLTLEEIDMERVERAKGIFETKCQSCHQLDKKLTAPSLRYVTERRSPEFMLNMMMNPDEMVAKHPITKQLLGVYMNKMTFQNLTMDDAKDLLDYLRHAEKEGVTNSIAKTDEVFPTLQDLAK